MSPRHAALGVDHPPGAGDLCPRIADAARQGVEPLSLEVSGGGCKRGWIEEIMIPIHGCPIKHIAEADHPSAGELIIATNLTAASKATIVSRDVCKTEIHLAVLKYPADVGADVTAGPSNWRWRRRYGNWTFSWQISRQCLTCSQTNCRGSKQH